MKSYIRFFFATLLIGSLGMAQTIAESYEVGTWPGFRSAAISFTFDDNDLNQLAVVVPMFNSFDFKLTLFTLTGTGTGWRDPNWSGLKAAAEQGHEIASHTVTHPYLNQITMEEQKSELEDSYNTITSNIPGINGLTLAYPFCVKGNDSLLSQYYIGARGCQGIIDKSTPNDLMNISSIVCGTEGSVRTAANFNSRADAAVNSKGICVFLIHGVDDDGGWSPTESSELQSHLEYLKANNNKFWVATFGNIVRYIAERNAVSIAETDVQDNTITLQVTDTLEDVIYNVPVSIRRVLPDDWPFAAVTQNGGDVAVRLKVIDEIKYLQFDIVPDAGAVVLSKAALSGIQGIETDKQPKFLLSQNYPNPFNPETTIIFQLPETAFVSLKIMNMLGQEVVTINQQQYVAGEHRVTWDGKDAKGNIVSSGTYFCRLTAGEISLMRKMTIVR